MLGHAEFVQEILGRKPELAGKLDSRKSSPLHLAASKGYLDIVKKLVSVNPEMCLACDRDGKNPVHIAVIKGHVSVLKELVKLRPDAARTSMERGETTLHACVRFDQLEAMKFLMEQMSDHEFVNSKDDDGNTILHLAVADKQVEAIQFLTTNNAIEVNALNKGGFTALDILKQSRRDLKDYEIVELLRRGGAISVEDIVVSTHELGSKQTRTLTSHGKNQINMLRPQAGLNPPGGVWQDSKRVQDGGAPTSGPYHEAGEVCCVSLHNFTTREWFAILQTQVVYVDFDGDPVGCDFGINTCLSLLSNFYYRSE
ncbi:hypothetical protein Pint_14360 [Pistacia integerrima]|uniref:Uncharacterized protein n=1 Tax=Pistacia integerrima TaxID=434235 RepID=A0ACC0Y5H6_9ROSI|nr:hypothetical protein Pint_14360 [Pistacia integerrima]